MREGTPARESRSREEKKRERESKIIGENLRFASMAFDLERLLSSATGAFVGEDEVQQIVQTLPEPLRGRFEEALANYELQIIQSKKRLEWLEEHVELHKRHGRQEADARRSISWFFFERLTGARPVGAVRLVMEEGYILLICADPTDYRRAAAGGDASAKDAIYVTHSGGLYRHEVYVRMFKEYVPLLLVRGDQQRVEDVVAHERQHFIHDRVFGMFDAVENRSFIPDDETVEEVEAFRKIKDEVLAYMREGRMDFSTTLRGELYAHLFTGLKEEKRKEALRIIDATAEFFRKRQVSAISEGNRAILVYQLASVPFEKFERWLEAIQTHLVLDRYRALEAFDAEVGVSEHVFTSVRWEYGTLERVYPSRYPKADEASVKAMYDLLDTRGALRKQAEAVVFNLDFPLTEVKHRLDALLPKYHKAEADVWECLTPYVKEGRLAPTASTPRSYEYGEEDYYATDDASPELAQAQQALLDFLDAYPQAEIDAIVSGMESTADKRAAERARKKLSSAVKKFIHRMNGSRPCRIEIDREESVPHSMYIRVDFQPSPEQKGSRERTKGWVIDFELHSSSLAPPASE